MLVGRIAYLNNGLTALLRQWLCYRSHSTLSVDGPAQFIYLCIRYIGLGYIITLQMVLVDARNSYLDGVEQALTMRSVPPFQNLDELFTLNFNAVWVSCVQTIFNAGEYFCFFNIL